jgi:hypothetical protein
MNFNDHWDILHTIMEMKEKDEYLDKVEKRAKNNFKRVIKDLNRSSIMFIGDFSEYIGHKQQVKNINGEWMFKKVKEDEWKPITIDIRKCEKLEVYLCACYWSYRLGGHTDEEYCVNDEYMLQNGLSKEEYINRYIDYHSIHYEISYDKYRLDWFLHFYYIKNDTKHRLGWIYEEKLSEIERSERQHRHYMNKGHRYNDGIPPLTFINRLERGAKHYLTHRKYTYTDIDEILNDWNNPDNFHTPQYFSIARYFSEGIHQPEEEPGWV